MQSDAATYQYKWTIGIVTYHSYIYMKWQLKILYENNDPSQFQLIIVDNSQPNETRELNELTRKYIDKHKNIKIIYHTPKEKKASSQHGEGLNIINHLCQSQYILFQDPDFFWLQKNYLALFENHLNQGIVSIGAPYPRRMGNGHPDFPAVYGCAFVASHIKNLDMMPDMSRFEESLQRFPENDFSFDVAWKTRDALSGLRFISFSQELINRRFSKLIGVHSFEAISRNYFLNNKLIACHLFRGNFTGHVDDNSDPKSTIEPQWLIARDKYSKFYYQLINNNPRALIVLFRLKIIDMMAYFITETKSFIKTTLNRTRLGKKFFNIAKKLTTQTLNFHCKFKK